MAADGPGVSFSTAPVADEAEPDPVEADGGGSGGAAGTDEDDEMFAFSVAVTTLLPPGEDSFLALKRRIIHEV